MTLSPTFQGVKTTDEIFIVALSGHTPFDKTNSIPCFCSDKRLVNPALSCLSCFGALVLRPLDYVTKLVSGLLTCKLPLDGDPVAVHATSPGPSLLAQASEVSDFRRFPKHCRESKPTSISAWFSQLPCLGV